MTLDFLISIVGLARLNYYIWSFLEHILLIILIFKKTMNLHYFWIDYNVIIVLDCKSSE